MLRRKVDFASNGCTLPDLLAYAGNWVAIVNGHVIGVGKTAREAWLASRYQRLKEEPSLVWVPTVDSNEGPGQAA
jgi:hypothetical protein